MFAPQKLKAIRLDRGLSQVEVARHLGVTRSAYSSWETGTYQPNRKNLQALSDYYQVDITYFAAETEFIHRYLVLNAENRQRVLAHARQLYLSQLVPYKVHARLSAGLGDFYMENYDYDTVYFDHDYTYDIASWIHGDSMQPRYQDGEVALIRAQGFDIAGAVYAVVYNEETFIKKVYLEEHQVRLVSLNPAYADIYAPLDQVRIVGPVVHAFKPLEVDYHD